jgi:NitT/TauT family transport system permease protein/taurine transport system permease protein
VLYQAGLDIFPAMIVVGMIGVAIGGGLMTAALAWVEARATPWHLR